MDLVKYHNGKPCAGNSVGKKKPKKKKRGKM